MQVEAISAAEFADRGDELEDMAAFCAAGDSPGSKDPSLSYWRWLAPAWAGKSALMAHFVLHPPPDIDIVSFFITARLARQNDRAAFCEVVQRQLYALIGEEEPMATAYGGDEQLRLALDRAARVSMGRGRRLVLLIDGLDEDRGVTSGPESHSIAALLPRIPPSGMRVVLAGRPHPPVPDDVPAGHPLRDTRIDHVLDVSPYAQAVRVDAERELLRLLNGGGLGRELVGLVAAAGGGLSAEDLARLAGTSPRLVERELNAVSGRGFRVSEPHWGRRDGTAGPQVYLLAHEEVQQSAMDLLTEAELDGYRERLHTWAESWHRSGWPERSPEYLLRGYTQLLRERKDSGRLVRLVCDPARHERLWEVSGSDLEALTEIAAAFDLIRGAASVEDPDLDAAVRLAVHRDALHDRMERLPPGLIALWARLGHIDRAVSLAEAQGPSHRDFALGEVAEAVAEVGDRGRTMDLASKIVRDGAPSRTIYGIARSAARAGHVELALELTGMIDDPEELAHATAAVAGSLALSGAHEAAVLLAGRLAEGADDLDDSSRVWASAAAVMFQAGREQAGSDFLGAALSRAEGVPGDYRRAQSLAGIAMELVAGGQREQAVRTARQAADFLLGVADSEGRQFGYQQVVKALAMSGCFDAAVGLARAHTDDTEEMLLGVVKRQADQRDFERAFELADTIGDPYYRACALAAIAGSSAVAGQRDRALEAAEKALEAAAAIDEPSWYVGALTAIARAFGAAGIPDKALDLAREATDLARVKGRGLTRRVLVAVTEALARAGFAAQAVELAEHAAESLRPGDGPVHYGLVLDMAEAGTALATAGLPTRGARAFLMADHTATLLTDPAERAEASVFVAKAFAATGDGEQAARVAARLADWANGELSAYDRSTCLASAAQAFAVIAAFERALQLVEEITDSDAKSLALGAVVRALSVAGEYERAAKLVDDIEIANEHNAALRSVIEGFASVGALDRAEQLAGSLAFPISRDRVAAAIVGALATAGRRDEAARRAAAVQDLEERGRALATLAAALGPTAEGRRTLAEALSYARWDRMVAAVGDIAPQNLTTFADRLMREAGR
ncbi:hypothetical protein [Streptomyces sp. SID3212]|uniref:hypothetical protein n=1 Tax=Streptomyces sp. SID3212 TaxID=2690259 RepID=UPI0013700548|nr:hypothetical protein [Streptomyces sp. SID3212]MYV55324.1 hypothetical protein [Streptomyces sp. SID3212]